MLKKIFGTVFVRFVCSVIAFVLTIINAKFFQSEGVGTISLFVLGISLLQIFTSFFGSATLVYMLPKHDPFQLIFITYVASFVVNLIGSIIMLIFNIVPIEYAFLFILSAIFVSFFSINSQILLSKEKIFLYNITTFGQFFLLLIILLSLHFCFNDNNLSEYFIAYFVSYFVFSIFTWFPAMKNISYQGFHGIKSLFKQVLTYGIIIQIANLSQLLNYRLNYYFIELCAGRSPLGIYDSGTKISESIWALPKSISSIQYARISNCNDNLIYAKKITLAFVKISFLFSIIAIAVLLCLPTSFYIWVFSPEFYEIKYIITVLAFGVVIFSVNIILAHYFAGIGKFSINTIASCIGLIITILCCFPFIHLFKGMPYLHVLIIVSLVTSISYFCSFVFTFVCFIKQTKTKFKEFLILKEDISIVLQELKKILHR